MHDDEDDKPSSTNNGTRNGESSSQATALRRALGAADVEDQTTDQSGDHEAYPVYDSDEEYDEAYELEEARRVGGWHYYSAMMVHYSRALGNGALQVLKHLVPAPRGSAIPRSARNEMLFGNAEIQTKRFKAPKGKKIYVPVRVEPKVYLAAERTFLSWVSLVLFLLGKHTGFHGLTMVAA